MIAGFAVGYQYYLARVYVVLFGMAAIGWGLLTAPVFWQQAGLGHIAQHIIRGEPYNTEVLKRQIPVIDAAELSTTCRPIALWSAAIIRLRMVEQAGRSAEGKITDFAQMKELHEAILRSLSCVAAEPFLWLILYWVENRLDGFRPDHLKYLKASYQTGPHEGWVALKRIPVAFASYEKLPPDLAKDVIAEFIMLVKNEFYGQAAAIFIGPAWRLRNIILPQLATLPLRNQQAFARIVRDRDIDVRVPVIEPPDSKPKF